MPNPTLIALLARTFLVGEQAAQPIADRAARTLGRPWRWLRPLATRYLEVFAGQTRPRRHDVVQFFREDPGFREAWLKYHRELAVAEWLTEPPRMQPVDAAHNWDIPVIASAGGPSQR